MQRSRVEILAERMVVGVLRKEERGEIRVPQEADAEEIVRLALMPVGAREHLVNGRNLRLAPGNTGPDHDAEGRKGMEVVIHDFHLILRDPVDTGDGIETEAVFIKDLSGEHDLAGGHRDIEMVTLKGIIDWLDRARARRRSGGWPGRGGGGILHIGHNRAQRDQPGKLIG